MIDLGFSVQEILGCFSCNVFDKGDEMNRRFFGRKLAGVSAVVGVLGVHRLAAKDEGPSDESTEQPQADLRKHGLLVFDIDKVFDYEISGSGKLNEVGCMYSAVMEDGSRIRVASRRLLTAWPSKTGRPMVVDLAPLIIADLDS